MSNGDVRNLVAIFHYGEFSVSRIQPDRRLPRELGSTEMQSRTWISMLLLTGLFVVISTASNGQEAIGSTTSVKPQAEANTRTLSTGSSVYSKELIHTGDIGVANLRFHDNSDLSVGPKSSVRLDKFVYDPNKSAGSVAVEAARGSFRFATGAQSKGSYQVKTPYGTLGIRG